MVNGALLLRLLMSRASRWDLVKVLVQHGRGRDHERYWYHQQTALSQKFEATTWDPKTWPDDSSSDA